VLACDGIWDCLSNDQCTAKLNPKVEKSREDFKELNDAAVLSEPVEELFDEIIAKKI
jgi:serine/threonine protein phosphatase PrpC